MYRLRAGFIEGYQFVVEFDIANFFGEIDHDRLLTLVGRRVSDRRGGRHSRRGGGSARRGVRGGGAAQAERALAAVGEILASLGLRLHPDKTKVVDLREGRDGLD